MLSRVHAIPALRFGEDALTSASGLVIFQLLFDRLDAERLRQITLDFNGSVAPDVNEPTGRW